MPKETNVHIVKGLVKVILSELIPVMNVVTFVSGTSEIIDAIISVNIGKEVIHDLPFYGVFIAEEHVVVI